MEKEEINQYIMDMPEDVLRKFQFATAWQYDADSAGYRDPDIGVITSLEGKNDTSGDRATLQTECWRKFHRNPQMNTAVRGMVGRLTGLGFETSSEIKEIQEAIEEIENDGRNRLYDTWPRYLGRNLVEGELHLCFTCHKDGFIEVDFIDPSLITGCGDGTGIIYHPSKACMPLFYNVNVNGVLQQQIPSINIARFPDMIKVAAKSQYFSESAQAGSKTKRRRNEKIGGFYRFIVSWDKGFITKRAVSYLRTTLEWLNYYEMLKKYEIDHKRSSGAYLWIFTFENIKDYKYWMTLTDDEKRKTGIMAKKTPGGSLVLPAGMKVDVKNPNLSKITDQDEDIMGMISSGLNESEDVMTGRLKSTFAAAKSSRGPMSDRTADELAYFERFLRYDFWGNIFYLKSQISGFKEFFKIKEATSFDDDGEAVFENVKKRPEQLIDFTFPVSETIDFEGRARGLLGVKHGNVADSLGIPFSTISEKLGLGGYGKARLKKATEDEKYPELVMGIDQESLQEQTEAEPPLPKNKDKAKGKQPIE